MYVVKIHYLLLQNIFLKIKIFSAIHLRQTSKENKTHRRKALKLPAYMHSAIMKILVAYIRIDGSWAVSCPILISVSPCTVNVCQ